MEHAARLSVCALHPWGVGSFGRGFSFTVLCADFGLVGTGGFGLAGTSTYAPTTMRPRLSVITFRMCALISRPGCLCCATFGPGLSGTYLVSQAMRWHVPSFR